MRKVLVTFFMAAAVLGISMNAFGFTAWGNYTADGDWGNALNWHNGAPDPANDAWIYVPDVGTAVTSGTQTTVVPYVVVAAGLIGTCELEMRDSSQISAYWFFVGSGDSGLGAIGEIRLKDNSRLTTTGGYIDMGQIGGRNNLYASGNSVIDATNGLGVFVGNTAGISDLKLSNSASLLTTDAVIGQQATGYLTISDSASMTATGNLYLGNFTAASVGILSMNGGSLSATNLNVGGMGTASLLMTAGVINLAGTLGISDTASAGTIDVSGGTINANALFLGLGTTMMTVSGNGIVILAGDQTTLVQQYIDDGLLTADGYYFNGVNTIIPEPATMLLLGLGSLMLARRSRS